MLQRSLSALAILTLLSCSEASNMNQWLASKEQKEAVDLMLQKAELHYDRKEYDDAKSLAEKVYKLNPANEKAVILLGYIHLSLAGIDAFQLAEGLIELNDSKTSLTASSDATSLLSELGTIVGLESGDYEKMALENNTYTSGSVSVNGTNSEISEFDKYPIYLPKTAADARSAGVTTLSNLDTAIKYICSWVDDEAKLAEDERHQACPKAGAGRLYSAKAHYLWSIAHLAEAIVFNTEVLYQSDDATEPNLMARATALTGLQKNLGDFAKGAVELATVVDIIFPTSKDNAAKSMLTAIFNDLNTVVAGFSRLSGMPSSMTKSITKVITDLQTKRDKIATSTSSTTDRSSLAIKQQMTQNLVTKLDQAIKSVDLTAKDATTLAKKDEICSAYKTITNGTVNDACK